MQAPHKPPHTPQHPLPGFSPPHNWQSTSATTHLPAGICRPLFLTNLRDGSLAASPLPQMPLTAGGLSPRPHRTARGSHALHLTSNKLAGPRGAPRLICCNVPKAAGGLLRSFLPLTAASWAHLTVSKKHISTSTTHKVLVLLSQTSPYPHPSTALLNCSTPSPTHPPETREELSRSLFLHTY